MSCVRQTKGSFTSIVCQQMLSKNENERDSKQKVIQDLYNS